MTVTKKITTVTENIENDEKNSVDLDQALAVAGKYLRIYYPGYVIVSIYYVYLKLFFQMRSYSSPKKQII